MFDVAELRPGLPEPPISEALNDFELGMLVSLLTGEAPASDQVFSDIFRILVPRLVNEVLFHRELTETSGTQ